MTRAEARQVVPGHDCPICGVPLHPVQHHTCGHFKHDCPTTVCCICNEATPSNGLLALFPAVAPARERLQLRLFKLATQLYTD